MSNLNKVMVMGRLTRDPEMRFMPSGEPLVNFSIAINRYGTGANGEKKEFVEFVNLVAFKIGKRDLPGSIAEYTRKGSLIYAEGRLQTRSWEGTDGQKHRTTEVVVNDVQFLSYLSDEQRQQPAAGDDRPAGWVNPDDIPF